MLLELIEPALEGGVGLLVEAGQPQVADVAQFQPLTDHLDMDDLALHGQVERLVHVLPPDGQGDPAVRRTAHVVYRLVQRQALHGLAVQRQDQVPRLHPGAGGRRVVDRADDLDEPVILRHLDPEAAELAPRLHLHVAEGFGVHVIAVRIEAGQHPVDRVLDQVAITHRLDIFRAHPLEYVAEQGQQAIGVRAPAVLGERCLDAEMPAEQTGGRAEGQPGRESGAEQKSGLEAPGAKFHSIHPLASLTVILDRVR